MTTIKITQLQNIGNGLAGNTLLPVVNTTGTAITQKVTVGNVANFVLGQAGNTLAPAFLSTLAYSVVNAAQPNITSVGTLNINTLNVSGGTNGYILQTNGNGNLSWVAQTGSGNGNPGGSNSQLQFNNGGVFAGDPDLTWDAGNNKLTTANLAASTVTISGNANTVNLNATGNVRPNAIYTDHYYYANGYVFGGGGGNGAPGGTDTQIQFNDNGAFGGNTGFTFDKVTGILSSPFLTGNGSGLSSIAGANVTGTVANATYATNIAGANVTGAVTFAGTANSVAVANVVGLGNIATLSLSGSTSNVLYGNGTFAAVPAPTVSQDITSNGAMSIMLYDGNIKYNNYATVEPSSGNIAGGNISANGNISGGNISATGNITANNLGNISSINIDGSNSNVLYGNGVFAAIAGGANTGNVTFDDVTVQGGNQLNLSAGPDYTANLAYLQVRAGDVASHIHLDTGNNQAYDLIVGDDQNYVQVSSTGNILLSSYDSNTAQYTWTLDYNGNLILAGGNSVIQSIANSSLDILNPNVSTMVLTPDSGYSSQALVLDPTSVGHIHLRSPGSNIDQPSANLFLGGEASSFEVGQYNGAVPNLFIHSNNNTWMFDIDGNLTLPQLTTISDESGIGTTLTLGVPPTVIVISGADFSSVNLTYTKDGANSLWYPAGYNPATDPYIEFTGGEYGIFVPGFGQSLYVNTGTLNVPLTQWNTNPPLGSVAPTAVYTYGASGPDWVFGDDGLLTLPGGNVTIGSVLGGEAILASNTPFGVVSQGNGSTVLQWIDDISNATALSAIYINSPSGNTGDVAVLTGEPGANANIWTFGANGTLTLPASSGQIGRSGYTNGIDLYNDNGGSGYVRMNYADESVVWADPAGAHVQTTGGTWDFGTDGALTLPEGGAITNNIPPVTFTILYQYDDLEWSGNTLTFTNASSGYMLAVLALMEVGDAIVLAGTPTTVTGVYTGGGAGTFTVSGTGVGQQIAQFTLPNRLTSVNGIKLTTNSQNYLFTEAGVTQSPVLTVDTLPSGQFAVAGFRAFVSDANLAPVGNFGAIVGNSGSNTVCVWCDGTNWRIG